MLTFILFIAFSGAQYVIQILNFVEDLVRVFFKCWFNRRTDAKLLDTKTMLVVVCFGEIYQYFNCLVRNALGPVDLFSCCWQVPYAYLFNSMRHLICLLSSFAGARYWYINVWCILSGLSECFIWMDERLKFRDRRLHLKEQPFKSCCTHKNWLYSQ